MDILKELRPILGRLPRYVFLTRLILRDGATAPGPRRVLMGGLAYLLSPIDPVPGFLPVIGQLDDLLVALYTLRSALHALPPEVHARVLREAGLDYDTLEKDLELVKRVATRIALKAGQGVLRAATRAGRWLGRTVAGIGRRGRRKAGRRTSNGQAGYASPSRQYNPPSPRGGRRPATRRPDPGPVRPPGDGPPASRVTRESE